MSCAPTPDCGVALPVGICPPAVTSTCPPNTCTPSSYTCGDWTVTTNADCSTTRTRTSTNLTNGVFQNATVTVLNGCITKVANGTRVLQSRPEPCGSTGTLTPSVTGVTLSPAPCNLLTGNETNLFAGVTFNQVGQNISVTGCGTAASPFVATTSSTNSVASSTLAVATVVGNVTVNSVGVDYTACGTQITAGIVKTYAPGPAVISGTLGITNTLNTSTCTATLAWDQNTAQLSSKTIIGVSCGNAFLDPATGTLPVGATIETVQLVVVGSRTFVMTSGPTPITIYNSVGTPIWSGASPGYQQFATPALAYQALADCYSFSGQVAC